MGSDSVHMLTLACVTLSKLRTFSMPQGSHLQKRDNSNYLTEVERIN